MDLDKRPQPTPPPPRPASARPRAGLRASDADRDRVADVLRDALAEGRLTAEEHAERVDGVYRAKTVGELEPIVEDLPALGDHPSYEPARAPAAVPPPAPAGPAAPTDNLVAVFSSTTRRGRWRVGRRLMAFSVFGNIEIDLSEAIFEYQHVMIKVVSVFGNVEISVPENISLRGGGGGILGNFEVDTLDSADQDAPVVFIDGLAVLGSIEAKPRRGRLIRDLQHRLRKHLG